MIASPVPDGDGSWHFTAFSLASVGALLSKGTRMSEEGFWPHVRHIIAVGIFAAVVGAAAWQLVITHFARISGEVEAYWAPAAPCTLSASETDCASSDATVTVRLPHLTGFGGPCQYHLTANWGDGTTSSIGGVNPVVSHQYASPDSYLITVVQHVTSFECSVFAEVTYIFTYGR
jgi:hypothetical protein